MAEEKVGFFERIGGRVIRTLGLTRIIEADVRIKKAEERAHEAYTQGYNDGNDDPGTATFAPGGQGYRRSTGGGREGMVSFEENLNTAWSIYQSNPLIKRDSDLTRDYVIGGGFIVQAGNDALQEIVDAFIANNNLEELAPEFTVQLGVFGVQCYPFFVRESDGRVILGYVDPAEIERVVLDPNNTLRKVAVVVRPFTATESWEQSQKHRVYRIVESVNGQYTTAAQFVRLAPWELEMLKSYSLVEYSGDCLYYRVNSVSNMGLGYSDFLQVADLSDQWDQTLFALGEREQMAGFFAWFVKLIGAKDPEVKAKTRELANNPPARGSVNVHNDAEEWSAQAPDLKQQGSIATVQEQRVNIIGGLGKPEAWYGRSAGTHLATAQAQGDPTWRSLEFRQGQINRMLTQMCELARDQAIIAGRYHATDDEDTIIVIMPEMTSRDMVAVAGALASLASALMVADQQGYITGEIAQEIIQKFISEMGVDIDLGDLEAPDIPTDTIVDDVTGMESAQSWFEKHAPLEG